MRLSDAIATGRCLVTDMKNNDLSKCALGMACLASGIPLFIGNVSNYAAVMDAWPWLSNVQKCPACKLEIGGTQVIWHLFDVHVIFKQDGILTLDQLIDWVRSVEPAEETEADVQTEQPQAVKVSA